MTSTAPQYSTRMPGLTIMPTETKKMAPKRSLIGAVSFSIFSASSVSAKMLPIMKAPKAEE